MECTALPIGPHVIPCGGAALGIGWPPRPLPAPIPAAEAAADEPALCLQCDMNHCYSRLRRLVPTIPPNKKVSKVEILQHVIDYILDLQLALETHPALLRQPPPPASPLHPSGACPAAPPRTPLTALNTDPAGAVNKQGDSILCR
uniref:DNA-binding protein inhibitor ID-4 n=1 Tax=Jaculus jaculus TaxID=51337 RepID=A0A8C5LIS6_JACJA